MNKVTDISETKCHETFIQWKRQVGLMYTTPMAWSAAWNVQQEVIEEQKKELQRLSDLLNTPHTDDWFNGVRLEAAHQIQRWGVEHDAGKSQMDWFWLIGYLSGKALAAALRGDVEKAKHHTISSGAALLNWFRAITGDSNEMRPGIQPPKE